MPSIVDIPGGTATFRDPDALAVRHRRPVQVLAGVLGQDRSQQIGQSLAAGATLDSLGLDEREYLILLRMNEATLYALLESWSIGDPLPRTADEIGDMNGIVYDALMAEAARLSLTLAGDDEQFTLAAVGDTDSPTGASAASKGPSAVVARRAPSDRKKPSGGRSTATARRSG